MKPDPRYVRLPLSFWAYVRSVSEYLGYTDRKTKQIKVPRFEELHGALSSLELINNEIISEDGTPSMLAQMLLNYFSYRSDVLTRCAQARLMNANEAKSAYLSLRKKYKPKIKLPMNKQSGRKRQPAYLTAIVNMIINHTLADIPCDLDPRALISITRNGCPLRTLSRRFDGAFPAVVNPLAVWEIKEYYYTTTFGSRVADGVYESLLDGMELEELNAKEKIHVKPLLSKTAS